ncbi:hypothetical protein H8959_020356 [Pygathrix nigripes]
MATDCPPHSAPDPGIICSRRHMWWQQRRFCLVTLQGLGLGKLALEVQLQKEAAELELQSLPPGTRSFDPQVSIVRSTVRVIGALVFGHHFLSEDPIFQELTQAIDFGLALVRTVWHWLHDVFPWALRHLLGPHREIFRYQGVMRSFIRREITGSKLKAPEAPKDFINCSLAQISKTCHQLLAFSVGSNRFMSPDVAGSLQDKAGQSFARRGTIILPNLASVLYDPECWETPPQFNPGHFLDKDGNFVANEAFLPFSAGHCMCPGDQLARMELFLMFATLLRTFRFQLPEGSPGLKLEYIFGGTLQPQPQEICAVPRLNSPSPGPREDGL